MTSVFRFGIFTKLVLGFGFLCLMMLALTHQLLTRVETIDGDLGQINAVESVKQRLSIDLRANILDRAIAVRDVTLAKTDAEMDAAIVEVKRLADGYAADVAQIRAIAATVPATVSDENALLSVMAEVETKIAPVVKRIIDLQEVGGGFQARKVMREAARPLFAAWLGAIDKLIDYEEALTKAASEGVRNTVTGFQALALKSLGVAVALALIAALFVSRSITVPMRRLQSALHGMLDGKTDGDSVLGKRRDEIGGLARAFASVRDSVTRQAAGQAETQVKSALMERAQFESAINQRDDEVLAMRHALDQISGALEDLADNRLDVRLEQPFAASFDRLRQTFNLSVEKLQVMLEDVAADAASIDTRAQDVGVTSGDLARRTERQAQSLEETAAALEQITANVSSASKRSEEARIVAAQANVSAAQSGNVVGKAVDAMQRIEQSSSQISNIIGVIDEIAFQTNLLALNAGVEAARAGDAGKGFAVVAQEVRELAQRSAKAAKEIKDLIRNSGVEVQNGVSLVRETGASLSTIGGFVVTINEHIDAIAASAREQSARLGDVNAAITRMDKMTQENSSLVGEAGTASAELSADAVQLQQRLAAFGLGSETSSQIVALRHAGAAMTSTPAKTFKTARAKASAR